MEYQQIAYIILFYFVAPVIVILGLMFWIRRKRDKDAGRPPSNKISSIKEEELKNKNKR